MFVSRWGRGWKASVGPPAPPGAPPQISTKNRFDVSKLFVATQNFPRTSSRKTSQNSVSNIGPRWCRWFRCHLISQWLDHRRNLLRPHGKIRIQKFTTKLRFRAVETGRRVARTAKCSFLLGIESFRESSERIRLISRRKDTLLRLQTGAGQSIH